MANHGCGISKLLNKRQLKAAEKTEPSIDTEIPQDDNEPSFDFEMYNKKKSAFKILENYISFKEQLDDDDRIFYYTRVQRQ